MGELPLNKQVADMLRSLVQLGDAATRWTKDVAIELANQLDALAAQSKPRSENASMLAADNTIELPAFVRARLAIVPGQYVYFVRQDTGFRIMSEFEMDTQLSK